jgi:uncharacterized repeat protein (TIGR03803 family)
MKTMASPLSSFPMRRAALALVVALAMPGCGGAAMAPAVPNGIPAAASDGRSAAYKSLHLFRGGADGANPYSALTDVKGTLYGVTYGNRVGTCGYGTVFSVTPAGKERAIYCFKGMPDGAEPVGTLLAVGGSLYGTTFNGGSHGLGSVFQIDTSGKEHVIYSFAGGKDGTNPGAGLIELGGKLYGTTLDSGGAEQGTGTVFEVSTAGKERVLYTFKGFPSDGETPDSSLIAVNGSLYGTTQSGGANRFGTVFVVDTSGHERMLYSFKGAPDGALPIGNLLDVRGVLYGTTSGSPGTVFKITTSGVESVVYTFAGAPTDGSGPHSGLTAVGKTLYGTTEYGGANDLGTIFSMTKSGKERMLYSFKGTPKDGANPFGNLTAIGHVLYGTALNGGINVNGLNHPDAGSIFKITL